MDDNNKPLVPEVISEPKDTTHKRPTFKQQKFIDAYIANGGNATEAALVAYDCSTRTDARNMGCQNLAKPHIQNIIQTKVSDLKDKVADTFKNNDLLGLALDTAHSDLQDPDPKVRDSARKYVLEVAKFIDNNEKQPNDNVHNHLHLPAWKGNAK